MITDNLENDDAIVPAGYVKLGSAYIKEIVLAMEVDAEAEAEAAECGICYTNKNTVTTNCGHQYCRVCVQNQCIAIQHTTKGFDCAFCRSHVTQWNTSDESTHGILCAFIDNVFRNA